MTARLVRALVLVAVLWTAMAAVLRPAHGAEVIEVRSARIESATAADGWMLAADFSVPLPVRLEDAINRGVALYFAVDFELVRPRLYWWDEKTTQATRTYRLSYHALTRQYRLSVDGFAQAFASLDEAIQAMSRVRGWRVLEPDQVRPGNEYVAQLRMRLDTSMLPKPFQVSAITNRDWTLQAEWTRFRFAP